MLDHGSLASACAHFMMTAQYDAAIGWTMHGRHTPAGNGFGVALQIFDRESPKNGEDA